MPPTPSPTYQRLRDTIAKRMRMSHVYQPRTSAQGVARRILGEDATQIEVYTTERPMPLVGKVQLQRHHPQRTAHLRPGGRRSRRLLRSSRAERRRARGAAGAPPKP